METTKFECPICLSEFIEKESVTTETCNHKFCKLCFIKWVMINQTCPLDRLEINNIFLYNKQQGIINKVPFQSLIMKSIMKSKNISTENHKTHFLEIFSRITNLYNEFVSIKVLIKNVYKEYGTIEFELLLSLNAQSSENSFRQFFINIENLSQKYVNQFSDFQENIEEYLLPIEETIDKFNLMIDSGKYDSDFLSKYNEELEIYTDLFEILTDINDQFKQIKETFLKYKLQTEIKEFNNFHIKSLYENGKHDILTSFHLIFQNIKLLRSKVLDFSTNQIELNYENIFKNSIEYCLICEEIIEEMSFYKFNNCHHKICKNCQQIYLLSNLNCPFQHQSEIQNLINNYSDVETYLDNAYRKLTKRTLQEVAKVIDFTSRNVPKIIIGDKKKYLRFDNPNFCLFSNIILKRFNEFKQNFSMYSLFQSCYSKHLSPQSKKQLEFLQRFYDSCENLLLEIIQYTREIVKFEDIYMNSLINKEDEESEHLILKEYILNEYKELNGKFLYGLESRAQMDKDKFCLKLIEKLYLF